VITSHPLLKAFQDPASLTRLTPPEWENLLAITNRSRLTASLSYRIELQGVRNEIPAKVWQHFEASRIFADYRNRLILWEMNRIQQALKRVDFEVITLKGGAYLLMDLPLARGRLPADLDILVKRRHLPAMEELLLSEGWKSTKLDDYDQRYYREWMHEIPPLRHSERRVEVDVHHALLPMTARIHADPELLWSSALQIEGSRLKVLDPEDMILHTVVHLFYDSDFNDRLRDLLDIDELLRHFSAGKDEFFHQLTRRAEAHGLERPFEYAMHVCRRMMNTPIPDDLCVPRTINPLLLRWMNFLITRAMLPDPVDRPSRLNSTARWLLYVRSHYLRMPLRLLLPHLLRKSIKRT